MEQQQQKNTKPKQIKLLKRKKNSIMFSKINLKFFMNFRLNERCFFFIYWIWFSFLGRLRLRSKLKLSVSFK